MSCVWLEKSNQDGAYSARHRRQDPKRAAIIDCMEYDGLKRLSSRPPIRQCWLGAARHVDEHSGYTSPRDSIRVNGPLPVKWTCRAGMNLILDPSGSTIDGRHRGASLQGWTQSGFGYGCSMVKPRPFVVKALSWCLDRSVERWRKRVQ